MLSFTERMDLGRELAQVARNRGQHVGAVAKGWAFKRPAPDAGTWDALCLVARAGWRQECDRARNDFAAACLNPLDDQPDTWEILL